MLFLASATAARSTPSSVLGKKKITMQYWTQSKGQALDRHHTLLQRRAGLHMSVHSVSGSWSKSVISPYGDKYCEKKTLALSIIRKSPHFHVFSHVVRQQAGGRLSTAFNQLNWDEAAWLFTLDLLTLVGCQLPRLISEIWLITLSTCQGRVSERCCRPFWPFDDP